MWVIDMKGMNMKNKRNLELIKDFLVEWYTWVEAGAKQGKPYNRRDGLCISSKRHGDNIMTEMRLMWYKQGLDIDFPFGESAYYGARYKGLMHLDNERLEWVCKTIKQLEVDHFVSEHQPVIIGECYAKKDDN